MPRGSIVLFLLSLLVVLAAAQFEEYRKSDVIGNTCPPDYEGIYEEFEEDVNAECERAVEFLGERYGGGPCDRADFPRGCLFVTNSVTPGSRGTGSFNSVSPGQAHPNSGEPWFQEVVTVCRRCTVGFHKPGDNQDRCVPAICEIGSRVTFNAGNGDCTTYMPGSRNHPYCDEDSQHGLTASHVCSECGKCEQPKLCEIGSRNTFNPGNGNCTTYTPESRNHQYCDEDSQHGLTASQVCHECGGCQQCPGGDRNTCIDFCLDSSLNTEECLYACNQECPR